VSRTAIADKKPFVLSSSSSNHHQKSKYYTENKISDRRNLVSQFISNEQANKLVEVLKLKESYFTEQFNGTFVYGCEQLVYGYGETTPTAVIPRKDTQKQRMTRHTRKRALLKNFLEVSRQISDYAEIFFNTSLKVESCVFNIRKTPGLTQYLSFANGYNVSTRWTHGVHVDQCQLDFTFTDRVECRKNEQFKANRHFTAILYLHEVEGGNFAFVDLPRNHTYRSLTDIPAPSNLLIKEAIERSRKRKLSQKEEEKETDLSPSTTNSSVYFLTQKGFIHSYITSRWKVGTIHKWSGKYSSELPIYSVRHTLSLWFTRED